MAVHTTELASVSWTRMIRAVRKVHEGLLRAVGMKLVSFRDTDRTHLRDLIELGLIDASWLDRLSSPLAARLRELREYPE